MPERARPDPATLRYHVLSTGAYEADVRKHSSADYEGFILPGAYYNRMRHALVTSEAMLAAATNPAKSWRARVYRYKARLLFGHEGGHAEDAENGTALFRHPTDLDQDKGGSMQGHAWRVGFDLRAASWTLRWRVGKWRRTHRRAIAILHAPGGVVRGPWPQ